MPRRVSDHEIDEYVEAGQHARLDARRHDPRWRVVPDEWTAVLGGGTWQETTMATITFEQIAERVAAHAAEEAARNAPIVVALDALNTLRTALIEMRDAERSDIRDERGQDLAAQVVQFVAA